MENKKPNALGIVLATVALTGVLLIGVASNSSFEKTFFRITANDEKTYTQVFNAGNAPTDSAEFQESLVTTWGHASYTYKNVKAAEGAHCVLAAGGSITKNEEALDLIGVQVTFEGDLDLLTTFEKDGEESRYDLTSGEVQYLCGNYVEFVANTETKIIDMTLNYACQATFTYAHNFVETERTETNGDDEDRVWECKKCHLTEARVDPE